MIRPTLYSLSAALLLFAPIGCGKEKPAATDEGDRPRAENQLKTPRLQPAPPEPFVDRTLASRIDAERLERAIHAAAGYIIRSCDAEGMFNYCVNLNPEVKVEPSYNVIRHAGAIYALGAYNRWCPNESARQAMRRASEWLKRNALAPVPGAADMSAIWSSMTIKGEEPIPIVQLGAPGLGLVALAELRQAVPEAISLDELRKLGRFLLYMQKNDGSFYSAYDPADEGRCDKWYCLYYPGEVMLGLAMLSELDREGAWQHAASNGILALEITRRKDPHPSADHWALLATAKLFESTKDNAMGFPRELWRRHAAGVCRGILADRQSAEKPTKPGDLSGDGHTCRIAVRLEGLAAARSFLQDGELNENISTAAADAIGLLLNAQIRGGQFDGAFTQIAFPAEADPKSDDFLRATEIRIDYVQHTLNAMILCAKLAGLSPSAESGPNTPRPGPSPSEKTAR